MRYFTHLKLSRHIALAAAIGLTAGGGLLLAGCASQTGQSRVRTADSRASNVGVVCSRCKIIWNKSTVVRSVRALRYPRHFATMACPSCHGAVVNFFTTGRLKHTCSACRGTLTICNEFWL